jgi:hypothetical protein
MKTEREKVLAGQIARVCDNAWPYLLQETMVLTTINIALKPKATIAEFEAVAAKMEERAWIKRVPTDDGLKIKLTDEGKAELL